MDMLRYLHGQTLYVCVQVWRVEDLELVPVDPECFGYFYGGDCYLILYTYLVNSRKCYLLYIWQVSHYLEWPSSFPAPWFSPSHCSSESLQLREFEHSTVLRDATRLKMKWQPQRSRLCIWTSSTVVSQCKSD